jgi:hypothetical protein
VDAVTMPHRSFAAARRAERNPAHPPGHAAAGAPALDSAPTHLLLRLQRTHGNRYVQRLLRDARSEASDAPIALRNGDEAVHRANTTGMPDDLKSGAENISGLSLDDVRVHYNSPKPAQLHALAYTKGTNIYLGPGQVGQLPHEAWHVVQQKQGRVTGIRRGHSGINVADDPMLEREADRYGYSAPRFVNERSPGIPEHGGATPSTDGPVQCRMGLEFETGLVIQNHRNYSYSQVLIKGNSGWEAINDNGNLEIRTSPKDSYGPLEGTMADVQQFIDLVKELLKGDKPVTLQQVAATQLADSKFTCIADATIKREYSDADIVLLEKKKQSQITEIGEEKKKVQKQTLNLVGSVSSPEDFEAKVLALTNEGIRQKVESLRGRGKKLKESEESLKWETKQLSDKDVLAQPQVTFGVPLGKIHMMLNKAYNTPSLAYRNQFAAANFAKTPPRLIQMPVIDASVIRRHISNVQLESEEARDSYVGFLSLVCLYVKRGMRDAGLAGSSPDYVKSYFDVMSRTDFNSMYQQLSSRAKTHFEQNGETVVIGIVWENETYDKAEVANRKVLSLGIKGKRQFGPTLGQWIESIHDPKFRNSSRMKTDVIKDRPIRKGKNWETAGYVAGTEDSPFAKYLKTNYVDLDKKLMDISDIKDKIKGKALGDRDLLSRGEVLYDSQSMGLLGFDPEGDPAFPRTPLVLLEFRGIQGELFSRYWAQLAKELYEFSFISAAGKYVFADEHAPAANSNAAALAEFLDLFFTDAFWRQTAANPWLLWRVALTNRYFYNLLRRLFGN